MTPQEIKDAIAREQKFLESEANGTAPTVYNEVDDAADHQTQRNGLRAVGAYLASLSDAVFKIESADLQVLNMRIPS